MLVLLTGGFGNVGRHVLDALLTEDLRIRCLELDTRRNRRTARRLGARIEFVPGDLRDPRAVREAVANVDVIVHMAFVIYPGSEATPELAETVNVGGTGLLLEESARLPSPPRFVFASSYHVHAHDPRRKPPLRVTDPVSGGDAYARHKIEAERLVRESGLRWSILRLSSVMIDRKLDASNLAVMFRIPLDTRFEMLHPSDAGRAFVNAVARDAIDGRVLFVGGGRACQTTYREFYRRVFDAAGLGRVPESAFPTGPPWIGDWLDTADSERLLTYQRLGLEAYYEKLTARGPSRLATQAAAPLIRRWMVRHSPARGRSGRDLGD